MNFEAIRKKINPKTIKALSVALSILGFSLIFVGGFFSAKTNLEKTSEYAAEVVVNHTKNKNHCGIIVESKDGSSMPDGTSEFLNLYGTFKEQKITFAPTINADKARNIIIDGVSDNLTMVCLGPLGSEEYEGHYKHYTFPIETMFPDERLYHISQYVMTISQSHADKILEDKGVEKTSDGTFALADYESLIKSKIKVKVDEEEPYEYIIQNIYLENNYYYKGINDVCGDFVVISYDAHSDLKKHKQFVYFLTDYAYQNQYFMSYINNVYSSDSYKVAIAKYNLIDEIDEAFLLSFFGWTSELNFLSPLCFVFAYLFIALSLCGLLYISRTRDSGFTLFSIALTASTFLPYILFSLIYKITGNVIFMSDVSSSANGITILVFGIIVFLIGYFRNKFFLKKNHNRFTEHFYEMDI